MSSELQLVCMVAFWEGVKKAYINAKWFLCLMVNGKQNSFNILNAFRLISVFPLQIYFKKKLLHAANFSEGTDYKYTILIYPSVLWSLTLQSSALS